MKSNVYLLKCDFGDQLLYKIGFTKRPVEKRLKELKTGNANEIKIVSVYNSEWSIKIESIFHRLYSSKRVAGEWFELSTTEVDNFLENCKLHQSNLELLSTTNTYYIDKNA